MKEELLKNCRLCPRLCGTNRMAGQRGACGMADHLYLARAALHFWEEPCLSGEEGSGTVFFSGCSLRCVYCQNQEISRGEAGKEVSEVRLAEIFLELQQKGANNINLVTPTHFLPWILPALDSARKNGLSLPVVYNTSGYETVESLRMLEGYIDIYLPDFKYWDPALAQKYSSAPDYPQAVREALDEMVRQTGQAQFNERGMMTKGVMVRHLVLPGHTADSQAILQYLYHRYGDRIYLSLMNQYTPIQGIHSGFPELSRKLTESEYSEVVDYALSLGVENGFLQEGETAEESFIPPFDCEGVLPKDLAGKD